MPIAKITNENDDEVENEPAPLPSASESFTCHSATIALAKCNGY